MGIKDRKNLRVVEGYKGSAKKRFEYYAGRIKRFLSGKLLIIAGVCVAAAALFLYMHFCTYTSVKVVDTYNVAGVADSSYKEFIDGVLKYSRDGISYLDINGEEQWNQPYQIKTPFVEVNGSAAAVANKGGNEIMVFHEEGLKGEIKTTLPIEKVSVSEQGIVSAILKNETAPRIICYDAAGNILVEHNISLSGMGYPMDVALSANGELLQVVYLHVYESKLVSKVVYYNFGETGASTVDHQVASKEYENTVIPTGFFMDDNTSAIVGDNCMTIFKGNDTVEEVATIAFDKKIQSVGHNDKYIAIVLQNSGETGYELRVYNKTGKMVTSEPFTGNYRNIKVSGNQVIMYDGKECMIIAKNGVMKFDGEMNQNIQEIMPSTGTNKYMVMNANGMENVRLAK